MERDPVCGMSIEAAKALTAQYGGKTYYFCSKSCKAAFEKAPTKYARP